MWIYILIYFLLLSTYFVTIRKPKNVPLLVTILSLLAIFVGISDMLGGYDRYIYAELFDSMADVTRSGGNPWTSNAFQFYGGEFGWGTLCALISYITKNRYIFIFLVTIIIYLLLFISIRDYTNNYPFAVLIFMALWFFFTFAYLRQSLGVTTAWLAVRYITRRDLKRFLLVLFIAFSFHNSALIFLPMYFIPIKKYSEKTIICLMIVVLLLGLTPLPSALFATYGELDEDRANVSGYSSTSGFRIAYFLEASFFLYMILSNYKQLSKKPRTIVLTNMAFVFCAVLLFFIKSENGGRLGWYYLIGCISTMTTVCHFRNSTQHKTIMFIISLYLYFRIVFLWNISLYPYKTFFTDGFRMGDIIHDKYEYDSMYDKDKFYR